MVYGSAWVCASPPYSSSVSTHCLAVTGSPVQGKDPGDWLGGHLSS